MLRRSGTASTFQHVPYLEHSQMTTGVFSCAAIKVTQYLIEYPCANVRYEKMWGVEFPGHGIVEAGIEWHPTMVCVNEMDGCLPWENGTGKNLQTLKRHQGMGAPPIELTPPPTRMPHAPPGKNEQAQSSKEDSVPPRHVYIRTHLLKFQFFNLDTCANNHLHDYDCVPDLLTDEATSACHYTIWCVVMQLASIFRMRVAYWVNLQVLTGVFNYQ